MWKTESISWHYTEGKTTYENTAVFPATSLQKATFKLPQFSPSLLFAQTVPYN